MRTIKFTVFSFVLLLYGIEAQSQFQRRIGGTNDDVAESIIRTTDGGFIVAGSTQSFGAGGSDMYIVKLDNSGTLQWNKTIGGTDDDGAGSIIQTTDGGYAVAGWTASFGAGDLDFYIVKLDTSGTLQWSKTVGGIYDDGAYSFIQTSDGGYAVAGWTVSFGAGLQDLYIVKLDSSGTLQWSRTIGGAQNEYPNSIIRTTDGGYAVAGWTGAGNGDFYIVKLNASGTLQWTRTIGGGGFDAVWSIIQTTDGGYAAAGNTDSFGAGNYDCYIIKLDGSGTLQWSRTIGGTNYREFAFSIIQTTDGGYAAAGWTQSFGAGLDDMYIVKLDGSGSLQWSKTIGGASADFANSIIQTTDGGYAVAGSTTSFGAGNNDMYVVKLDGSGNTCGNSSSPSSISGSGGTLGSPTSIVSTATSTVTTPPSLTSTGGTVTSICTFVGIQPISNETPNEFTLSQNYPNPFNPVTKINFNLSNNSFANLVVYDALGREVETLVNEQLNAGIYEVDWNAEKYSSGVYYYKLSSGDYTETKKMILIK